VCPVSSLSFADPSTPLLGVLKTGHLRVNEYTP